MSEAIGRVGENEERFSRLTDYQGRSRWKCDLGKRNECDERRDDMFWWKTRARSTMRFVSNASVMTMQLVGE